MNTNINLPIYLDLGGALAAFGLIFAVYQFRKSQWEVVLKIRSGWQRSLFWILGSIGLLLTLIRVLISEDSINWMPFPFNIPLSYEIAAYLFFIASPLSLIYYGTKIKQLFCLKNARKFYEVIVREISKTNDDGTADALEILYHNFEEICDSAKTNQNNESQQAARSILDVILSDESMVKLLTTKRLDVLRLIFFTVEKYGISRRESGIGIPTLVKNLFNDKESFFYKQLDRDGLALTSNLFDDVFNSPIILTNFDLFGYPTLEYSMRKELGIAGVGVFIKALSQSILTYLKTDSVPPRHINNGLHFLSNIFGDLCLTISMEEKRGVDTSYHLKNEWEGLRRIACFLGHDYPFLGHQEQLNRELIEREKCAQEADFYSDSTINAGISAALYKAFEQLAYIENTTEIYKIALDLLNGIGYERRGNEGYRVPFEKRMWEQIATNVLKRYYPAAMRSYLEVIGFFMASTRPKKGGWFFEQAERMKRLLAVDLKPLLDADAEMVNKEKMKDVLLSKSMNYENGNFTYRFGLGRGEKKTIPLPTNGAVSALEGVDVEHPSKLF